MKHKGLKIALIVTVFVFIMLGHLTLAEQSQGGTPPPTEPLTVKIINASMPFLLVLGGAVGPTIVFLLQYKTAKRIRMDQVLAEKKIKADSEAYTKMKKLASILISEKEIILSIKDFMKDQDWFFENRLFLPGKFPNKWMTIRNGFVKLFMLEDKSEEAKKIRGQLSKKVDEAIREIYKDVGASEIKVEPLDEKEVKQARANKRTPEKQRR